MINIKKYHKDHFKKHGWVNVSMNFEDKFLEHYGCGHYITCKPNRLVFTKGGVWHSVNRVDKDAGDHVRMTIVAFFIKK